jgi:hypothetical protein
VPPHQQARKQLFLARLRAYICPPYPDEEVRQANGKPTPRRLT